MPSCPGIEGCLSISILTSLTLPLAAWTTFSSTGASCLQGPHHSAQKSTRTGWRFDSSITSFMKVCVVVSLTATLGAAASPLNRVISSILAPTKWAGLRGCSPGAVQSIAYAGLNGVWKGVGNQEL